MKGVKAQLLSSQAEAARASGRAVQVGWIFPSCTSLVTCDMPRDCDSTDWERVLVWRSHDP